MKKFTIGKKNFDLKEKTLIMGVLNVTPDSFSDGGKFFDFDKAIEHAVDIEKQGADILDVGGESTRPSSSPISEHEEIDRVIPVIEEIVDKISIPISVDTYKSKVAMKAIESGASMINDVTALSGDSQIVSVVSEFNIPICLMHMKGTPRDMQNNPVYNDVMAEVKDYLKNRADYAISKGVKKSNIIIDPGIGFGKRTGKGVEDNCEIIMRLKELKKLGYPILIGASRKTFIGNILGGSKSLPADERLYGSIAAAVTSAMNGANIIRVHDVKETHDALKITDVIKKS